MTQHSPDLHWPYVTSPPAAAGGADARPAAAGSAAAVAAPAAPVRRPTEPARPNQKPPAAPARPDQRPREAPARPVPAPPAAVRGPGRAAADAGGDQAAPAPVPGAVRRERPAAGRAAPELSFRRAVKRYGDVLALDGVDLDVLPGELVAFLGPSGCGKTTLLRVVAGLEPLSGGSLEMLGVEVNRDERLLVSPERRPVAMVFQEHALWPHLTAEENVAFPLLARGVKRPERRERARELLSLMDLDGRGDRRPGALSGGELQRVALARALIVQPRILLLDEPLASLDAHLRRRLRQKIRRIHEGFSMTTLYVTHDRDEALAVADRIVLQRAGRVLDQGSPELLNARPRSAYAAQLLWDANLLPAEYLRNGWWRTPIGVLKAASPPDDRPHVLLVHPETLVRAQADPDFEGEVEEVSYRGCFWDALVNVRGEELLWRSTEPLDPGQRVGLRLLEEPSPVPDDR